MPKDNKLLYEQIVEYLKNKILSKELERDDKLPTELDLAKQFGVSRITSKRALEELKIQGFIYRIRGSGSFVASIEERTHHDLNIPAISTDNYKIISIVLPFEASFGGLMNTIKGASEILNMKGYYLSIHSAHRDIKNERRILNELYEKNVGGIIYYPISDRENLELMNRFYLDNYPIITIDKYFESIPISYVISDNIKGSYDATSYLIKAGHKNIGFISDVTIESATSVRKRYFGYCQALKENDIRINESFINVGFNKENDEKFISMVYDTIARNLREQKVTAVVCVNDYVASYLMRSAMNLNIKIPEELSIIGYDNIELAEHLQIPLTTVAQDFDEMGRQAAKLLIDSIENEHNYEQIVLPANMVIRKSCKTYKPTLNTIL